MNMNIINLNEWEDILQSYNSYVCYIDRERGLFINFKDSDYSRTTRKHVGNFIREVTRFSDYKDFVKNSDFRIIDLNDNPSNVSDVLQMAKDL